MADKMVDLIYAEGHTKEMQADILGVFPGATFNDASDFIHRGRFEVTAVCTKDNWRLQMLLLGLFDFSLHMQMWKLKSPEGYIKLMRHAVEIKKVTTS